MLKKIKILSIIFVAFTLVTLILATCSPKESLCDRLYIEYGEPAIRWDCNSISGTTSNITYDAYGRVVSFEFDYKCTNSSEAYNGKFYNIKRNQFGQATGFDAVINGESCHYP